MTTTGPVPIGTTCRGCGHMFTRGPTHPEHPADLRHALARVSARQWLGPTSRLPGIAIYQALVENA